MDLQELGKNAVVSGAPNDTFNLIFCIFFLLGIGNLMPVITFTTAIDYFELLYPTGQVNRVFTVASRITALITIFLLALLGRNIPSHLRIYTGFAVSASVLLVTPAMGALFITNTMGTSATYAVTVAFVAMTGAMSSLTEGSIVGAASELPAHYMQAFTAGISASGVLTCILRLMSRAMMPQTQAGVNASAYLYFVVGAMIPLACIAGYNLVRKLPMMRYYSEMKRLMPENVSFLDHMTHPNEETGLASKGGAFGTVRKMKPISYMNVWKRIQGLALSVGFIYVVTTSIFPAHITEDFYSSYFGDLYPVFLTLCYYCSDIIGKCLPSIPGFLNRRAGIGGSLARALFYPLFYLCIYGPTFFQTEVMVIILTCLLGLTGGYCLAIMMMLSPKCVSLEEAEVAGFLLVLFIKGGLAAGSIVEWVWIL